MNYTYIAIAISVLAVITFTAIFILRSDEAKKIRKFFKWIAKEVTPDPTSIKIKNTNDQNNANNEHLVNSWKAEVISGNNIIVTGNFSIETFEVSPKAEREKHYFIGFSDICDFHINPTAIAGYGELAYIRYDRNKKTYYLWDTGISASVFSDSDCTHPIENQNVKISDGLELFFTVANDRYTLRFTFIKD